MWFFKNQINIVKHIKDKKDNMSIMPLIWETDFFSGQSPKKEELNIEYTAVGELGEYRGHGEMLSE